MMLYEFQNKYIDKESSFSGILGIEMITRMLIMPEPTKIMEYWRSGIIKSVH